jgi:hypothetical protein
MIGYELVGLELNSWIDEEPNSSQYQSMRSLFAKMANSKAWIVVLENVDYEDVVFEMCSKNTVFERVEHLILHLKPYHQSVVITGKQ